MIPSTYIALPVHKSLLQGPQNGLYRQGTIQVDQVKTAAPLICHCQYHSHALSPVLEATLITAHLG